MGERADEMTTSEVTALDATTDSDQKPEEIRAEIEQTRAQMSQTIDAIQEKLSPDHLKEQVKEATVGKVQQAAHSVGDKAKAAGSDIQEKAAPVMTYVKRHPLPVAGVLALGLGWLIFRKFRHSPQDEALRIDTAMGSEQWPANDR